MKPLTYRIDRLYHKFLKPEGISIEKLHFLATELFEHGFIELLRSEDDPDLERYFETEKLTSRQHRDELFKIIGGLK